MASIEGKVGPGVSTDGSAPTARLGKDNSVVTQDSHARFQEAAIRGNLYSGGMTVTSISAATFTTATLGATGTPILGVYNPAGSGKNLVILQAKIQLLYTVLTMTPPGAFMWASSLGNGAVSTGTTPFNLGTGVAAGSVAKDMCGVAMTGQTNALVVRTASGLGTMGTNISTVQTAAGFQPYMPAMVDNVDGAIIVPPGGILALLCTTTPVAISAASSITWEEVPLAVS